MKELSECSLIEIDPYHIIYVKNDRFIGHGLNLSWKGKRPHPPRFKVVSTSAARWSHGATRRIAGAAAARLLLKGCRVFLPPRGNSSKTQVVLIIGKMLQTHYRNAMLGKHVTQIPAGQSEVQRPISRRQKYILNGKSMLAACLRNKTLLKASVRMWWYDP